MPEFSVNQKSNEADTPMIDPKQLERFMVIADDIKKEFAYEKCSGEWHWHDRGDEETRSPNFPTFYDALCDAVEPYVDACEVCGLSEDEVGPLSSNAEYETICDECCEKGAN